LLRATSRTHDDRDDHGDHDAVNAWQALRHEGDIVN
jgi:hypothetical protein